MLVVCVMILLVKMDEIVKSKRKTHTSTAVKNRYNAKHYKVFQVRVKPDLYDGVAAYMRRFGWSRSEFLSQSLLALHLLNDSDFSL